MGKDAFIHNRECYFLANRVRMLQLPMNGSSGMGVGLDQELCRLVARICIRRHLEMQGGLMDFRLQLLSLQLFTSK
jgi:hypothetical protein